MSVREAPINNKYVRVVLAIMLLCYLVFTVPGDIRNGVCRTEGMTTIAVIAPSELDYVFTFVPGYVQSDGTTGGRTHFGGYRLKYNYKDLTGSSYSGDFITNTRLNYPEGKTIDVKYLNSNHSYSCILNTTIGTYAFLNVLPVIIIFGLLLLFMSRSNMKKDIIE